MKNSHKEITDSQVTLSELMLPSRANFSGKIHGGYILSLMDQIAFACASKHSAAYCVTASVDTVNFLNPIEVGDLVTMQASINYVGNSSMVVGIRVESENIRTGEVKHCNSSYFTMVAKDENNKSVKVPGLILRTSHDIRRFVECIKRHERKKLNQQEFKETDFAARDYLDLLPSYNVELILEK